jgi:hypothetical protein
MLEPLRMWDCLCKCYMLCLWGWEIVYINVTCIYERCAFEMWDCLSKCYMHLLDVPLRMWDCLCECYMHLLDVPLRCEIVYVNVTCIYEMSLWGCEIVYVNVTWIIRCACECMRDCLCKCYMSLLDVPLRICDCLSKCYMCLLDVPLRMGIVYLNVTYMHLLDEPLRMGDCLCKCYMSLLDVPLRLFMWMLHAFARWAFEIVYVNVTCIR